MDGRNGECPHDQAEVMRKLTLQIRPASQQGGRKPKAARQGAAPDWGSVQPKHDRRRWPRGRRRHTCGADNDEETVLRPTTDPRAPTLRNDSVLTARAMRSMICLEEIAGV
jgi:hypothetical protein